MKGGKVHLNDIRLGNNAGIDFPACQANAKLLDLDKSSWPMTRRQERVTCENCLKAMKANYPRAYPGSQA